MSRDYALLLPLGTFVDWVIPGRFGIFLKCLLMTSLLDVCHTSLSTLPPHGRVRTMHSLRLAAEGVSAGRGLGVLDSHLCSPMSRSPLIQRLLCSN